MTEFDLSLVELDLIGDALALDLRVHPFDFPSVGYTLRERKDAALAASNDLHARGYARGGKFTDDIEHAVTAFSLGRPAISVVGNGPDGPILVRATAVDPLCVVGRQRDERLYFTVTASRDLVPGVLAQLPQHGPRRGGKVSLSADQPQPDDDEDFTNQSFLESVNPRAQRDDKETVRRMIGERRLGEGSMLVSFDVDGSPARLLTLDWFDTEAGRTVAYSAFSMSGTETITYAPGTPDLMSRVLTHYLRQVRG